MRYIYSFFAVFSLYLIFASSAEATKPSYSCANVRCASGTTCVETPLGPSCEANYSAPTCASTSCMVGHKCVESPSGPQCIPMATPPQPHPTPYPPSYPSYHQQSCAYGGYYSYGRLICNPAPAWREPYRNGWNHHYYQPPRYEYPRRYRRRPHWHPEGPDVMEPAPRPSEPTMCPMIYQPVCAQKTVVCVRSPCPPLRKTFGNSCEANAAGYSVLHSGTCR